MKEDGNIRLWDQDLLGDAIIHYKLTNISPPIGLPPYNSLIIHAQPAAEEANLRELMESQ
jgi:hypothetical protein